MALAVWGCRAVGVEPGRVMRMPEVARGWARGGGGERGERRMLTGV